MIHHYGIEVKDLKEAIAFYEAAYTMNVCFETIVEGEKIVFLANKTTMIELIQSESPSCAGAHLAHRSEHALNHLSTLHVPRMKWRGPYTLQNGWNVLFLEGKDLVFVEWVKE
ncbi:hypothetical protein A374_00505 [Fictibacillus macauensis ZFHKF-1]|uniref:Glyoxalase/fosfomycin resistance/dioxygenase domain-containing protein n=1 Tax=Fictibacillus macauensis ZFHKF-1 TaxID=1196324 RepID=I8ANK4_9BACL|nr:VOC family protein [Fictibacillus macauensis]EIT87409.1 hypothetical protein A374_00505 [Fictibacillus macauensis ZFHKF-1]